MDPNAAERAASNELFSTVTVQAGKGLKAAQLGSWRCKLVSLHVWKPYTSNINGFQITGCVIGCWSWHRIDGWLHYSQWASMASDARLPEPLARVRKIPQKDVTVTLKPFIR